MRESLARTMPEWCREYFERGYAQRWGLPAVSDQIRLEAEGLWKELRLSPGAWVLDLGCGHGRHAVALEHLGARVVGMDFSESLLSRAKSLAGDTRASLHWLRGDMRQLPLQSRFFAGATVIDAFGFYETEEENEAILGEVRRVLAPEGRFGMKVVNGVPILAGFRETDSEERGGVVVTISRQLALEPSRMTEKVIITGSRGNGEYERRQRLYCSDELCGALERMGFTGTELFASYDRAVFEPATSKAIWAFGQRPASES
jgi:SAM-dependent methyltransferase